MRTGRASTGLLDRVTVNAYGTRTPLNQLATINAPEPRLLTVQPYDRSIMASVEKAIMESDLGLTPNNDGQTIRLPIPQLTEERRKEMVRAGPQDGRGGAGGGAQRPPRRPQRDEAGREGRRDVARRAEPAARTSVQKLTDAEVKAIDELMARKEAEILEV